MNHIGVIMSVMSVCNHEGAMGRVTEQQRERVNRMEVRREDADFKGQVLSQVNWEEFWVKLQHSCIVFSLYWYSRFTLMGD